MLIINRFTHRATGKSTIQAHVLKGKKIIKSYDQCNESFIDIIAQHYSFYMLCDVDYKWKLGIVNLVNVK